MSGQSPLDDLPVSKIDGQGIVMNLIPAGSFWMGSEKGANDEKPVHEVFLESFYIDVYPVINASFVEFLNERGNQRQGSANWFEPAYRILHKKGDVWKVEAGYNQHPVVGVTWYGAQAYCAWRDGRLPTEAEWEKSARGGFEGKEFPWGDEKPACNKGERIGAQFADCKQHGTAPVGSFSPNGYGLFDMAGNVWEWVQDWYRGDYYQSQPDWKNPPGPATGKYKVLRGGSWKYGWGYLRVAYRDYYSNYPDSCAYDIGFRCAASVAAET